MPERLHRLLENKAWLARRAAGAMAIALASGIIFADVTKKGTSPEPRWFGVAVACVEGGHPAITHAASYLIQTECKTKEGGIVPITFMRFMNNTTGNNGPPLDDIVVYLRGNPADQVQQSAVHLTTDSEGLLGNIQFVRAGEREQSGVSLYPDSHNSSDFAVTGPVSN